MSRIPSLFSKVITFLVRYRKHPLYMLVFVVGFFLKSFSLGVRFYKDEDVVAQIKEGKSIIRFGDGDMVSIPLDIENCYHFSSQKLKDMYTTIIKDYSPSSPYILSVPIFINYKNTDLKKLGSGKIRWGVSMKTMFLLRFNKEVPYMDAHNFYYDNYFEGTIAPLFKDKQVIFLTNKKTIDKQKGNTNLIWKSPLFVEAPSVDALNAYDAIKIEIDQNLSLYHKSDVVIFAAMGPVGKYIIYEYAKRGYQGIDIGKVCEVMFTGESIQYMI